jgi:GNAT superfamily N-acetyltransferase
MAETLQIGFDGFRAFAGPGWRPPDARAVPEISRGRARLTSPGTWAAIAEEGALVVGHAAYVPQPGAPGSAHLWQLFVRPQWWGSGVAADLLHAAIAAAAREGYGRMRFFTPRDQARARAFYEREGFRPTGWEGLEEPIGLVLVEYALEPLEPSGATDAA